MYQGEWLNDQYHGKGVETWNYGAIQYEGDFVEAGVWRGGVSAFARGIMDFAEINRTSWLFDSFEGLPPATTSRDDYPWHFEEYVKVKLKKCIYQDFDENFPKNTCYIEQ